MSLPAYGTAPIKCGKRGCNFKGHETDLVGLETKLGKQGTCPTCGCKSYIFMTQAEIDVWKSGPKLKGTDIKLLQEAFDLLAKILDGDVGRQYLNKLDKGTSTDTDDGRNWLAAYKLVKSTT